MDKVAQEIEAMTGAKTAVAVEGVTLWQRMIAWVAAWWALRSLPKGQRYVRAGFKAITMSQLQERLGVNAMNASPALDQRWQWLKAHGFDMSTVEKIVTTSTFSSLIDSFNVVFKDGREQWFSPHERRQDIRAAVKMEALSDYVRDEIPARCLASVKKAKTMGLKSFYVAFPVIEAVPQKDPIIVARWTGKVGDEDAVYLEIDMWE